MPNNIIRNMSSINVMSYQKPFVDKFNNSIIYGLNAHDDKINKELFNKIMLIEMYDWLNKNNCCSNLVQCNFTHINETLQYLDSLRLNINTTNCC